MINSYIFSRILLLNEPSVLTMQVHWAL